MCSYCGCRALDEVADLTAQHEEIINATGAIRKSALAKDRESVKLHVASLVELLLPHTIQEETGVFAELSKRSEFKDHVKTLCAEHERLHHLFDRLSAGEMSLVDTAIDELREHIEKEENGLFPAAAVELEGVLWQDLAERSGAATRRDQSDARLSDL